MKIINTIIFFVFAICMQNVAADSIIRLNTTGQPPLNTKSQDGFMDEVATEAFRRIGIQLQTALLPAERGLKQSNRGLVDGEMSRIKGLDKKYPNLVRVPEKIMDWEFVSFSYQSVSLKNGWSDLSGKLVAYINGWKILERNIPSSAEITKTANVDELFNLLRKKRTDFTVYERWAGHYRLHQLMMNDVKELKPPLAVKEMFIYLHKKHRSIIPKLSSALSAMKKDGSYQKLVKKHLTSLQH